MKKIFVALFFVASFLQAQTNKLLDRDFWNSKPTLEIIKTEISNGNNPSEANQASFDVVTLAINNGADLETIKYLIELPGNSVTKHTHDGRHYIHWAASKSNLPLVQYLIKKGSDVNHVDDKGAIPMVFAANFGVSNPEIYNEFFKAGINPKQKYTDGATILLLAIGKDKDLQLTKFLETKGLSIKDVDDLGRTAFDYAAKFGDTELLEKIKTKGIKPTNNALIFASEGTRTNVNNLDTYKYLVENVKLDPKFKDADGQNVLHNLTRKKDQESIVSYFLTKGVDPNTINKEGNNALYTAVQSNNIELVKLLLPNIKDINTKNNNGETVIFAAIQNGSPELVNFLIDKGAKTDIEAKDGNLASYLVQSYKTPRNGKLNPDFTEKLNILFKKGIDIANTQYNGNTLLNIAISKNDINLLKALEPYKIDVNKANNEGLTPLHRAAMMSKDSLLLNYLVELGANKTALTEFEESAYDLASENEELIKNNVSIEFLK